MGAILKDDQKDIVEECLARGLNLIMMWTLILKSYGMTHEWCKINIENELINRKEED